MQAASSTTIGCMNVMFATKDFRSQATLRTIREHTLERRNLMNVMFATKDFCGQGS